MDTSETEIEPLASKEPLAGKKPSADKKPLAHKEFIAVTDEILYQNPALIERLVPYHVDRTCRRLEVDPLRYTPADLQTAVGNVHNGRTIYE